MESERRMEKERDIEKGAIKGERDRRGVATGKSCRQRGRERMERGGREETVVKGRQRQKGMERMEGNEKKEWFGQ